MIAMKRFPVLSMVILTAIMSCPQASNVLTVVGRGAEDKEPYRGGGKLRFLDARLEAHVAHYDGGGKFPLPLVIDYEVVEPAPIVLTSRLGTEYFRLYGFSGQSMSAIHTDERIKLSEPGKHTARATQAEIVDKYGPKPSEGIVSIRGHYYYLIDPADGGQWLDVMSPPGFFNRPSTGRKLTFTIADVSEHSVEVAALQSTWKKNGPVRVKITVTNADGDSLPIVNLPLSMSAGDWQQPLETEWAPLDEPTGWMRGKLPEETVPERIAISGSVAVRTPDELEEQQLQTEFEKGDGKMSAERMKVRRRGYRLPRNNEGIIRETRAIWAHKDDFATSESREDLVRRCAKAGLNTIIPIVSVRSTFAFESSLLPEEMEPEAKLDPLEALIEKAHAKNLEVHPWFCVSYRDAQFREWFEEEYGVNIDLVRENGQAQKHGADVHHCEYRDFMVRLMSGVARKYDVDGIHLDYIRSMGRCHCKKCRREFKARYGHPIAEATDKEWIEWQRGAISDIVRRAAAGVRAAKPEAKMSAAVFSNLHGGALQGQDPANWAREGWIDLVIPMDYSMQSLQVHSNEQDFLEALEDDDRLVTGLSLYQRSGGKASPRPAKLVKQQIELVRSIGIHGYCLFCYKYISGTDVKMLRTDLNAEPAVPFFR